MCRRGTGHGLDLDQRCLVSYLAAQPDELNDCCLRRLEPKDCLNCTQNLHTGCEPFHSPDFLVLFLIYEVLLNR